MEFSFWKQTTDYTCGPTCFMVTKAENESGELNSKKELLIWKAIIPGFMEGVLKKYIGSPPIYLVRYINNFNEQCKLHIYKNKYGIYGMEKSIILKYKIGTSIHNFLSRFIKFGKLIHRNKIYQRPEHIIDFLKESEKRSIIQNIVVRNNVVHFVLIRMRQNVIYIMDPEKGVNEAFNHIEFVKKYNNILFGYSIHLDFLNN